MTQRLILLLCSGLIASCAAADTAPKKMEIVAPQRLPDQLRQAALAPPPMPAQMDELGQALVPEAPQMQKVAYEAPTRMAALDPIVITDDRAPRGKTAAEAVKAGYSSPTPPRSAPPAPAAQAPVVLAFEEVEPRQSIRGVPSQQQPQQAQEHRDDHQEAEHHEPAPAPQMVKHEVAKAPQPAPAQQMTAGGYGIHLASYRQADRARAGWDIYTGRHADLLSALSPQGVTITIPEKGDYIRLLAGSFASREAAEAVCDQLSERDEYCKVMPLDGASHL